MHERITLKEEIQKFIGEGAVLEHGVIFFSYLNEEGGSRVGYVLMGDMSIQQLLGMVETGKAHILYQQGDLSA